VSLFDVDISTQINTLDGMPVNVLKSTFLGSEFHTECLVIKMKKNENKIPPPPSLFFTSLQQKGQEFFRPDSENGESYPSHKNWTSDMNPNCSLFLTVHV